MASTFGFGGDTNAFNDSMYKAIADIEGESGAQELIDNELANGDDVELPKEVQDLIDNAGTLEDYK